jgi:hypothetical protein
MPNIGCHFQSLVGRQSGTLQQTSPEVPCQASMNLKGIGGQFGLSMSQPTNEMSRFGGVAECADGTGRDAVASAASPKLSP